MKNLTVNRRYLDPNRVTYEVCDIFCIEMYYRVRH